MELVKANFLPAYLAETLWLTVMNVQVNNVNPNTPVDAPGACPIIQVMIMKTHFSTQTCRRDYYWSKTSNLKSNHENGLKKLRIRRH